jgi:hypothetical protein
MPRNTRKPDPTKPDLKPVSPLPQSLNVSVSSVPKRDWWERFPLTIGISLLALLFSIIPFVYSTWPAREDASVAIVRWVTPFTPDGVMHPQAWVAVANRGNRDIVVLQAPFMYQASRETMAFADDTALEKQSDPTVIEPGKSAVIRVSTEITSSVVQKAQMVPDQRRSDEKGSKAVIKLAVNVIVAHPSSGGFSSAITNCLRVLMYESDPVKSEADPNFVDLQRFKLGERKEASGRYPCLNDSPAPQVTHF